MSFAAARLELVVEELVLRGVPPEAAHDVAAALEARLAALVELWSEGGTPLAARAEAMRRLPPVHAPAAAPAALGEAVADRVWGALAGGRTR